MLELNVCGVSCHLLELNVRLYVLRSQMLFWRSSDICVLRSLSCDVVGVTSDVGKGDRCVADINKCRQAHLSRHVDPFLHLSSYEEGQPYLFTSVRMRRAFAIQPKFSGFCLAGCDVFC